MKKRGISAMLTVALACAMLAGCGSSGSTASQSGGTSTTAAAKETEAAGEAAAEEAAAEETEAASEKTVGGLSAATVVALEDLPVSGIGCTVTSDVKATGDYKIGYIAKNTTNPYMVAQGEGVSKAGEDMGFEAIVQAPTTADSVEEQVKLMEDMITQGVDAIIVHCADSNGIMSGVRKAEEAGILVVTIGTPAASDTFLRTGVDYYETGYVIAGQLAEELGGEGKLIILEGPAGASNAIERLNGIKDALVDYPNIEVVASQTANFKRTEGMSVTENLIQKYTDVDAIIGCNDESALGAVQALKAAGMTDVLVCGFDGSVDATNAIAKGEMYASYNTDPYGSGYIACAYLVNYLNDGTEPEGAFIPFPSGQNDPLITPDTVADYQANVAWFNAIQ
ncbi:MAG: sugar ABC transporter substrate-binding protein [Clostridiales bacterium]|nr:sugar ABC transporter substrate-binding protein [Clostridiales bacterium]